MTSEELIHLRKSKGKTQKEMANMLGLSTASAYLKKETGDSQITLKEAMILSNTFDIPITNFIITKSDFRERRSK